MMPPSSTMLGSPSTCLCLCPAVPALPCHGGGRAHTLSAGVCCSCREPAASLHPEAMASLAPRVALESTAKAILEVQGLPGARGIPEVQMAALEPTLREAPGAKEATEGLSAQAPTLRYSNHPSPEAFHLLPFKPVLSTPPSSYCRYPHSASSSLQGTVVQPGYGSVRGSNSHTEVRERVWGGRGCPGACARKQERRRGKKGWGVKVQGRLDRKEMG